MCVCVCGGGSGELRGYCDLTHALLWPKECLKKTSLPHQYPHPPPGVTPHFLWTVPRNASHLVTPAKGYCGPPLTSHRPTPSLLPALAETCSSLVKNKQRRRGRGAFRTRTQECAPPRADPRGTGGRFFKTTVCRGAHAGTKKVMNGHCCCCRGR